MAKQSADAPQKQSVSRVLQSDFPRNTLEESLQIPRAIWENYAGDPVPPHDVALAIDSSPTSSTWRVLTGSAIGYGLTNGGYNAEVIALEDLGRRCVAPTEEGDDVAAMREALLRPSIMGEFFRKYNRAQFPQDRIAENVLTSMGLPKDRASEAVEILKANGLATGILRQTKTGFFVALDSAAPAPVAKPAEPAQHDAETADVEREEEAAARPLEEGARAERPKPIFIGHGKDTGPLQKLQQFLTSFGVAHKVTKDEAHKGRPISEKVRETMRECGSAIIVFTRDEKFFTEDGKEIWRPSENVVHELGASLFAYDGRVVIFKEKGIELPSNYRGIGYIEFDSESFEATTAHLLKELIALGLLRITPT